MAAETINAFKLQQKGREQKTPETLTVGEEEAEGNGGGRQGLSWSWGEQRGTSFAALLQAPLFAFRKYD